MASSTECTGLIPSAPLDPAGRVSSYQAIYDVPMSKMPKRLTTAYRPNTRAHKSFPPSGAVHTGLSLQSSPCFAIIR